VGDDSNSLSDTVVVDRCLHHHCHHCRHRHYRQHEKMVFSGEDLGQVGKEEKYQSFG
jgi:hypothetical protein